MIRRGLRSAVAVLLVFGACRAPSARITAEASARPSPEGSSKVVANENGSSVDASNARVIEAAAPRRRASGAVCVRIAGAWKERLELVDVRGERTTLERDGEGLRTASGARSKSFEQRAAPGEWTELGERRYPGLMRVRVDRDGAWIVENEVEFEDYVFAVVAAELGSGDAPEQAWRAQAIAARSYALAALEQRGSTRPDPYLFDGVRDQAYAGLPRARGAAPSAVLRSMRAAVESTRGTVLVEGGACVDARYHAACGGRTAEAAAVFPELRSRCLKSVVCVPCARRADEHWRWTVPADELDALARRWSLGARIVRLGEPVRDASGRWIELELHGERAAKRVRFEDLRREFGRDKVRSARVLDAWPDPGAELRGGLLLRGVGRGHGAGLCQRGALDLAREGWSAERILAHYYGGARLEDRR